MYIFERDILGFCCFSPPISSLPQNCPFAPFICLHFTCCGRYLQLCSAGEYAAGLINTAEGKDWTQFSTDSGKATDTASMSSESTDDVWCITDEQREYYVRQFRLMQDDLHGVISGTSFLLFSAHLVTLVWQYLVITSSAVLAFI